MENKLSSIVQLLVSITLFIALYHLSGENDTAKLFSKILLIGSLTLPLLFYKFTSVVMQIVSAFIVAAYTYLAFYLTNPSGINFNDIAISHLDISVLSFSILVLLISWIYTGYVIEKNWAIWEMITLILMSIILLYTNIHSGWYGVVVLLLMVNTKSIFHKELDGKLVSGLLILMSSIAVLNIYSPENNLLASPGFIALAVPLLINQLSLNNTFKIVVLALSFILFSIGHIHILEPLGGPSAIVYFTIGLGISSLFTKTSTLRLANQILILAAFFVLPLINQETEVDALFKEDNTVVTNQTSAKESKPQWTPANIDLLEGKTIALSSSNTIIGFKLKAVGSNVKGEFKKVEGQLSYTDKTFKLSTALAVDGINTKISARDNSIKNDAEFFDMANYPFVNINYEGIIDAGNEYLIEPTFEIRGIKKKAPVNFNVHETDSQIKVTGKATINRIDFNMKQSGDIDDNVQVMFQVVLDK